MHLGLTVEFPYRLPEDVVISDQTVSHAGRNLPIRIYRPTASRGRAALVYIRGGGFVLGSLETHNASIAELAANTGLLVIAPDFRMAPEHPFPAANEDCYSALCGIVDAASPLGIDPDRVVLCGDSSGANQAVVVCMMSRDRGGPIPCGQALISPVLDFTRWEQGGRDAPLLAGGAMAYFARCYVNDPAQLAHPYISPLVHGDFRGLPPAYVMGAEFDSLVADAQEYVRRLETCGVPVEWVIESGLVHSPIRARALCPRVADAWQRFCACAARLAGVES